MKKKSVFFLILFLSFNIPLINCAKDEGYGEVNNYLGQFTDTFENDNNVSVAYQVINNVTLECMELNETDSYMIFYDDFEDNNLDKWDVTNGWSTGADYNYSSNYGAKGVGKQSRLIKDFGYVEDDITSIGVWIQPRIYRNYVTFREDFGGLDYISIHIYHRTDTNTFYQLSGVSNIIASGCVEYNWFYIYVDDIDFDDNTFDVYVYDDELDLMGSIDDAVMVSEDAEGIETILLQTGTASFNGEMYIDDFEIDKIGGYDTGFFITEDYLNYTTGNSLALLTNASIPIGTSMTVQFSNDNVTWVDNKGNVGSTSILDGFYAIDLRNLNYTDDYKMVNFTGTELLTPRLYQLREITTTGSITGGVSLGFTFDASGILIIIFLLAMGLSLIYGVIKKK